MPTSLANHTSRDVQANTELTFAAVHPLGADHLGGADEDVFAFSFGQECSAFRFSVDTGVGAGNHDLTLDFHQGEDKLDLSFARPTGQGGLLDPEFLGTDPFSPSFVLQVRYELEDDRAIVQFATNIGNPPTPISRSEPSGEIELSGIHHLIAEDFIF
jgi:hypothetical protein